MIGSDILVYKKSLAIAIILLLLTLACLVGINAMASEKIPNFGTMKVSDTRLSYFVVNINGKVKKIKMSQMETIMIAELFNTNNYTDVYTDNQFNSKISKPYIEVRINTNRILNLYCTSNGFVFLDKKKQYYIDQDNYPYFFSYCRRKYDNEKSNNSSSNEIYKPILFKKKNFLDYLSKVKCNYKILKTVGSGIFSTSTTVISAFDEEIYVNEFNDNINMELEAMKISPDASEVSKAEVEWAEKPHFFKKGNIIVNYNGNNYKLIKLIVQVMGKQYAGW
jgi:hypothetical protein